MDGSAQSLNRRRQSLEAAIFYLRQHRDFRAAVRDYCAGMIAAESRWPTGGALTHELRWEISARIITNYIFWVRNNGPTPTLALLKSQCRASARNISTFIGCLKDIGFLTSRREMSDARVLILEPTEKIVEAVGRHVKLVYQLRARLRTEVVTDPPVVDQNRIVDLLLYGAIAGADSDQTLSEQNRPRVAFFGAHEAGWLILSAVLFDHYTEPAIEEAVKLTYDASPREADKPPVKSGLQTMTSLILRRNHDDVNRRLLRLDAELNLLTPSRHRVRSLQSGKRPVNPRADELESASCLQCF